MGRRTLTTKVNAPKLPPGPVTIPYRSEPRPYQRKILSVFMPGNLTHRPAKRRGVWVLHRRGGKDLTALAGIIIPHMLCTPGTYWHIFPKFAQGKKAIWQESTKDGIPYLERFPPHLVRRKNDTEMLVEMETMKRDPVTGQPLTSVYQIVGGDTISEYLVGAGPKGVVFSEWPLMDKSAYDFVAPMLRENQGWALFVYTPRGKNHGWDTYEMARENPDWYCECLTIVDTGAVSASDIEAERREGRPEALIQQEYFCSWTGFLHGTIYGDLMMLARNEKRVTRVPYEVSLPVGCCLDIGRSDGTAIWFYQVAAREIRLIDYYACRGKNAFEIIRHLKEQKPYLYGRMVLPNDAQIKGFSATESPEQLFRQHWPDTVLLDKIPVEIGKDMVRRHFARMVFDEAKCGAAQADATMPSGLDSLEGYHYAWNDDKGDYSGPPVHDKYSHGADALRYGAMEGFQAMEFLQDHDPATLKTELQFNPFSYERKRPELAFNVWR